MTPNLHRPELVPLYACPACRGSLSASETLACLDCGRIFPTRDGRPVLLATDRAEPPKHNDVLEAQARARDGRSRCGVRQIADAIRARTTASIYSDDRHQVRLLAERVRAHIGAPGPVLDVGAAEQYYRALLEPLGPLVSLDIALYGATDVIGDCHRLPIRDSALAAIFAVEVLEHLERPWRFFAEAARALRPGGALAGVAPQYCPTHGFPSDFFRYTRHGLESLAADAGLEPVALWPIGGAWSTLLRWCWANHARESPLHRVRGANVAWHAAFQSFAWTLDRLDARDARGASPPRQEHQDHLGWAFVFTRPARG